MRCMDVFVEDENVCKAAWAVHVNKIYFTRWLFLDSPRISETSSELNVTLEGLL